MNKTTIEWTHRPETGGEAGGFTWNPIRARLKNRPLDCNCSCSPCARSNGKDSKSFDPESNMHCHKSPCMIRVGTFCTRISPGCANCYASVINKRFGNGLEYTVPNSDKVEFYIDEKILEQPLRRKKPATIFVGDMFDLFHEAIPDSLIGRVFAMANRCQWHTFQFLTKRAARLLDWSRGVAHYPEGDRSQTPIAGWPPNCWLGVSVESQKYADERIPLLLQTPAAVRFLSVEPMLEAVDLKGPRSMAMVDCGTEKCPNHSGLYSPLDGIDWVICGGESGRGGARPFNLAWAESLLEQCRAAGVAFFCKQLGSLPVMDQDVWSNFYDPEDDREQEAGSYFWLKGGKSGNPRGTVAIALGKDHKGGDPMEWPESLRVRQFPTLKEAPVANV
jgi:protein gp37